ncbi:hypothetical protein EVAR_55192_1 [Eumeta japonica]|uniref:Uncharacterized protein n=1 Tax=Eumeta variegata TaxID=151549 RepID=A0A4C1Z9G7_EUMVA|nr:hypothetical protein EVAR_55192_1 [Eumeta japonica]
MRVEPWAKAVKIINTFAHISGEEYQLTQAGLPQAGGSSSTQAGGAQMHDKRRQLRWRAVNRLPPPPLPLRPSTSSINL